MCFYCFVNVSPLGQSESPMLESFHWDHGRRDSDGQPRVVPLYLSVRVSFLNVSCWLLFSALQNALCSVSLRNRECPSLSVYTLWPVVTLRKHRNGRLSATWKCFWYVVCIAQALETIYLLYVYGHAPFGLVMFCFSTFPVLHFVFFKTGLESLHIRYKGYVWC